MGTRRLLLCWDGRSSSEFFTDLYIHRLPVDLSMLLGALWAATSATPCVNCGAEDPSRIRLRRVRHVLHQFTKKAVWYYHLEYGGRSAALRLNCRGGVSLFLHEGRYDGWKPRTGNPMCSSFFCSQH